MQEFEIRRVNGRYSPEEIRAKFDKYGILVLKEYLPPSARHPLRAALTAKLERSRARGNVLKIPNYPAADFLLGDILSVRELEPYDYVFFKEDLVETIKIMLRTSELVYYGDSSTQFDQAARGFHKDNTERYDSNTQDWVGDYGIVRAAFYCEDHSRHSGGLKVRRSSHNVQDSRSLFDRNKISVHAGKAVDVSTEFGDIVIWTMRLTHSGNYRKLRLLPSLCLHPRLEGLLPEWLALPEEERRYFMSCAFARPGAHLDHYIKKFVTRDSDVRRYLERARRPEEAGPYLASKGVTLRKAVDYIGSSDNDA
jgi:hypothetical protein